MSEFCTSNSSKPLRQACRPYMALLLGQMVGYFPLKVPNGLLIFFLIYGSKLSSESLN